jgi:hypothetical protein
MLAFLTKLLRIVRSRMRRWAPRPLCLRCQSESEFGLGSLAETGNSGDSATSRRLNGTVGSNPFRSREQSLRTGRSSSNAV